MRKDQPYDVLICGRSSRLGARVGGSFRGGCHNASTAGAFPAAIQTSAATRPGAYQGMDIAVRRLAHLLRPGQICGGVGRGAIPSFSNIPIRLP